VRQGPGRHPRAGEAQSAGQRLGQPLNGGGYLFVQHTANFGLTDRPAGGIFNVRGPMTAEACRSAARSSCARQRCVGETLERSFPTAGVDQRGYQRNPTDH
jgi:hypothetical protein